MKELTWEEPDGEASLRLGTDASVRLYTAAGEVAAWNPAVTDPAHAILVPLLAASIDALARAGLGLGDDLVVTSHHPIGVAVGLGGPVRGVHTSFGGRERRDDIRGRTLWFVSDADAVSGVLLSAARGDAVLAAVGNRELRVAVYRDIHLRGLQVDLCTDRLSALLQRLPDDPMRRAARLVGRVTPDAERVLAPAFR